MASPASKPLAEPVSSLGVEHELDLLRLVDGLLPRDRQDNRRWTRFPFDKPVLITPMLPGTDKPAGTPLLAVGNDLSKAGVSFKHQQPLPCRRIAVTLIAGDGRPKTVVTTLTWSRRITEGPEPHILSGGRFVCVTGVDLPIPADWSECQAA